MKALELGATGAVGRHIVESLIDNHEIQEIHVFVRRQVTYTSPKVIVHIVNFDEPREWAHLVTGDILFLLWAQTVNKQALKKHNGQSIIPTSTNGSHCSSKWSKKIWISLFFRGEPKIEILLYVHERTIGRGRLRTSI